MTKSPKPSNESHLLSWRIPTISEIATRAGVGIATVDRVRNNRTGVSKKTRLKVLNALDELKSINSNSSEKPLSVGILVESGISFNRTFQAGVNFASKELSNVKFVEKYLTSPAVDPVAFASEISMLIDHVDGLLLVAREHAEINRAIKRITRTGKPVICVTTDLPNSDRTAYVGEDQTSAGAAAALLLGNSIREQNGRILFVLSVPFRCQKEREQGFRHVLRTEFPNLVMDETVCSHEDSSRTYEEVRKYLKENRAPSAIYNVAGGNTGVAKALKEANLNDEVIFIGHELNENSTALLEQGVMDYIIGHRVQSEILESIDLIRGCRDGIPAANRFTETLIHTKYNCFVS
ncbi:MAG: LacI family DNA-binding transcriptional regulator [Rhodobacteraceae bacterium]|nr:LacI family DNA-binding transcriptional regulator [Paracoccaceae bacterium]